MTSSPADLARRYREARRDEALVVLEGFHALKHALRFGAEVEDVQSRDLDVLTELAMDLAPDVADGILSLATPVDDAAWADLSPAPHPTGVLALARRPVVDVPALLGEAGPGPVVLLDRPSHHGNIGAVIRVAAAADAAGVLVTGPHDPWHAASIRGGAGLQFALPVASVDGLGETDRPVVAVAPEGEREWTELPPRAVLVFGSERDGIGDDLLRRATTRIAIPMRPGVSSLNLATAVAVTLFCGQVMRPARRTSSTA